MASGLSQLVDIFSLNADISIISLIVNIALAAILSGIIGYVYTRFGTSIQKEGKLGRTS